MSAGGLGALPISAQVRRVSRGWGVDGEIDAFRFGEGVCCGKCGFFGFGMENCVIDGFLIRNALWVIF